MTWQDPSGNEINVNERYINVLVENISAASTPTVTAGQAISIETGEGGPGLPMTTRHLFDQHGGIITTFQFDWSEDKFYLHSAQDAGPILKANHELRTGGNGVSKSKALKSVASIPTTVILELAKQGILKPDGAILDQARFRAFLNSGENLALRTSPGDV